MVASVAAPPRAPRAPHYDVEGHAVDVDPDRLDRPR
jgi:hypothetical protein